MWKFEQEYIFYSPINGGKGKMSLKGPEREKYWCCDCKGECYPIWETKEEWGKWEEIPLSSKEI